jgi:hypothetical protein
MEIKYNLFYSFSATVQPKFLATSQKSLRFALFPQLKNKAKQLLHFSKVIMSTRQLFSPAKKCRQPTLIACLAFEKVFPDNETLGTTENAQL